LQCLLGFEPQIDLLDHPWLEMSVNTSWLRADAINLMCTPLLLLLLLLQGGSPWGAGTLAGPDGSRQPSEVELEQAVFQVSRFPNVVLHANYIALHQRCLCVECCISVVNDRGARPIQAERAQAFSYCSGGLFQLL
jgi:hypothetical protein